VQTVLGVGWPGTMGGLVGYLVADATATPPEFARIYAEKLVLMPYS
jgi:predicted O-linked N-acetylglucosamine transferase (SPINDLY family)